MNIVFFGTANVALPILEKLNKTHKVLAVVTNPDAAAGRSKTLQESPVSALARDLKLECLKPEKVKGNTEFLEQLKNFNAEIFVVVAYGKILPEEVINLPKLKTVNVHFSALPKYRGPSPIQAVLKNGDTQTGTSIFILDKLVDHGPMLAQSIVNIEPDDNFFTLSDRLARLSADLLLETLEGYKNGSITPLPQDDNHASHCGIISKEDGKINWQNTSQQIYNQFRAFYIWPGIWTEYKGKKIKILDCIPGESASETAGSVLAGGRVACGGKSSLIIKSLQPEGKSEMSFKDFLNGNREFLGSLLI